jgi:predicted acylesterase/phospholipase RssA
MAFEGCGCRASFHVGAIEWLAEQGMMPSVVAGASSGAMIAAATAVGRVSELRPVWTELLGSPVCSFRRLLRGRWPFRMSEIVGDAAARYFGDARLADTLIPLSIVVTQLRSSGFTPRALTAKDDVSMARAILASCFIPGPYSRHVPIGGRFTVDGAWLGRVPVAAAAQLGATRVIACVSDDSGRLLRGAFWTNVVTPASGIDYRVLSPIAKLPIRTFDFDPGATLETFAIGRASAEVFANKNSEWLRQP